MIEIGILLCFMLLGEMICMIVFGWVCFGEIICDVLFWYVENDFGLMVFLLLLL